MKRKSALVLLLLFLLMAFPRSASVAQYFQNPELPRDLSAGRPGSFHFLTHEQLRADRAEIADLRAGIERLQRLLPRITDPVAQREVSRELERWSLHAARIEQRANSSAGPTAASVEAHLNQLKGQRSCGVCHGGPPETARTIY